MIAIIAMIAIINMIAILAMIARSRGCPRQLRVSSPEETLGESSLSRALATIIRNDI